jgi:hypothetical protein
MTAAFSSLAASCFFERIWRINCPHGYFTTH